MLTNLFKSNIISQNLFTQKDNLLIAVSGGVDSVVLCDLCYTVGYPFSIAHCNFQLRGEESNRDEQFVRSLAVKYQVEIFVKKFETEEFAGQHKMSIQEAARKLRYDWFDELMHEGVNYQYLLTAHHADDNVETLLMNFFRGTGLHGLTGIPMRNKLIRRPLLAFEKEELQIYAQENGLTFVEDSSNQSSKYTRNFLRNELLPSLAGTYPEVSKNLQGNINRFKEIESLYNYSVGLVIKKLCKQKGNEVHIPVKQLMAYKNRALIYEIIAPYGFLENQIAEVEKLATSDSGKYIVSPQGNFRIIRHRHWFIICPTQLSDVAHFLIEEDTSTLAFPEGVIHINKQKKIEGEISTNENMALIDAKYLEFPLLLRKRKTGDYFYPLGMKHKKKISRFLIDLKLSKTQKENCWLIESKGRIVWVVGYRIDDRVKINNNTFNALSFTFIAS